jgi:DNA-directed RNA polymerase specialized sigma24 family protein
VLIGRTIPSADVAAALRAHGPVLLAAARTMTTNEADAQDLVPATFEIGLRSLPSLMDCGAMRYWLLRIEVREAIRMTGRLRRFVRLDARVHEIAAADATADRLVTDSRGIGCQRQHDQERTQDGPGPASCLRDRRRQHDARRGTRASLMP